MVIASLGAGGSERVLTMLAEAWAARGDEVTVITLSDDSEDYYALPKNINRIALNVLNTDADAQDQLGPVTRFRRYLKRFFRLREAISRSNPQVVVSFMDITNILTLFCTRGLGIPIIVSEHVDPTTVNIGNDRKLYRRITYPWAAGLTVLSEKQRSWAEGLVRRDRAFVAPNPILLPDGPLADLEKAAEDPKLLIAMGRLTHQKGFDLLIPVFARLVGDFPDWHLIIMGEGPDREKLESLIHELDLQERVSLPGTVNPPTPALIESDLFVFSSRFEGFGLALGEAMACGLPVVSFDCPTGPSDLVRHEVDGLLVPPEDTNALEHALRRLMSKPEERIALGKQAALIGERYGIDKILQVWDVIFAKVLL